MYDSSLLNVNSRVVFLLLYSLNRVDLGCGKDKKSHVVFLGFWKH